MHGASVIYADGKLWSYQPKQDQWTELTPSGEPIYWYMANTKETICLQRETFSTKRDLRIFAPTYSDYLQQEL